MVRRARELVLNESEPCSLPSTEGQQSHIIRESSAREETGNRNFGNMLCGTDRSNATMVENRRSVDHSTGSCQKKRKAYKGHDAGNKGMKVVLFVPSFAMHPVVEALKVVCPSPTPLSPEPNNSETPRAPGKSSETRSLCTTNAAQT